MDFSFSDEQTLLQESIERFIQNDYSFAARQDIVRGELGYDAGNWATFAELGWLGVPFPEEDGGFGGTAIESIVMCEQFGKGLVVEPFLATVVLAGGVIRIAGNKAQRTALLPGIAGGSTQAALAFAEPQGRYNLADLVTRAKRTGNGYVLNGYKAVVLNGPAADVLVVSARTAGEQRDEHGVSLFVVPADAAGLGRRDYPTVDAFRASEVTLENVEVGEDALLGEPGGGLPMLEQAVDEGTLAVGAEAVGCMEVLYKDTVEYCKTRKQFGQPIGKFQVLQHRMVDMFMEHEQAKSLMYMAAMRMDEGYGPRGAESGVRLQGAGGNRRPFRRPERRTTARRHGHDGRASHRPLLQAPDHDRHPVRQRRSPSRALRVPVAVARWDRAGTAPTIPEWFFEAVETQSAVGTVEVDDCDVVYRRWASAADRDMLLIHGMNAHSRWWDFIAPRLTDAYRVVAMDLTGMGDSDYRYSYDAATYAREIVGVCDAAGLNDDVIVVGHSFGGNVATKAANLYPDRFGALILADSGLRHPDEPWPDYPPVGGRAKVYPDRETALARFRLQPPQPCGNAYILEYIARHSLMPVEGGGWAWKFDEDLPNVLKDAEREPGDYTNLTLPVGLIYGGRERTVHGEDAGASRVAHPRGRTLRGHR